MARRTGSRRAPRARGFIWLLRTIVAATMLGAAACGPVAAQSNSGDEASFGTEMIRRLRATLPGTDISPVADDPLAASVTGGDLDGARVNFHRLYSYCQNNTPEDCEALKAEFLTKTTKKAPKVTAASLRLIVRDKVYVDYILGGLGRDAKMAGEVIYEQIGDDLFALLASDSADAIALVMQSGLKDLGLSREAAWNLAFSQTRAILPPLPTADQIRKGAIAFQDYEYLASLLIDRKAWASIAGEVGPNLFVTAVSDGFVFVGTMDSAQVRDFAPTVVEDCEAQPRCVSPHIYRFRNGSWSIAD